MSLPLSGEEAIIGIFFFTTFRSSFFGEPLHVPAAEELAFDEAYLFTFVEELF